MKKLFVPALVVVWLVGNVGAQPSYVHEEAAVYTLHDGTTLYFMGSTQIPESILEGLKGRTFEYVGRVSQGHEPKEKRYCRIPLQYKADGQKRESPFSVVHCKKDSHVIGRAFHYENQHYLQWLFEIVDETLY
jgi:hypothetical protein